MLVLGIDSASSKTGFCLLEDREIIHISNWDSDTSLSLPERLYEFSVQVASFFPVDGIGLEMVAVRRNLNTVRMLAYFEASAMLVAGQWGIPVFQYRPTDARTKAFKKALSKEQVYKKVKKLHKLSPYEKGGNDESDAYTVALACSKDLFKMSD
jgi:Holliday junction resolvasome RuvABC endonuclease subunit